MCMRMCMCMQMLVRTRLNSSACKPIPVLARLHLVLQGTNGFLGPILQEITGKLVVHHLKTAEAVGKPFNSHVHVID